MNRHLLPRPSRRALLIASSAAALGLPAWAQAPALDKVTLRVGDQSGQTQAMLKAAGLLTDVPYKIEWSQYSAAVNLHEALKADAIDVGIANDSPTVSAIAGGSKVVVVGGWGNGGAGISLLVPKNSPAKKLADLRGKTISPTTRGSVAHYLVVGLLKEAGIPPGDVKLAFLSPTDAMAAFGSGSIDAWAIWGVFRARAVGTLGGRVLDDGMRVNSGLGLLSATPGAVRDAGKLAAIRHYMTLVDRIYEWGRTNREAFIDFYTAFSKQERDVAALVWEENVAFRRVPADETLVARLKKTHQVWLDQGLLSGGVDFASRVLADGGKV